jgi:hypothetical protein
LNENSKSISLSHTHHCISGLLIVCCHVSQPGALHQANASASESEKEVQESHTLLKYAPTNSGFNSRVTGLENSQFHPIILKSDQAIAVGAPI